MAQWDKITSRGNVQDRRGMSPIIGGVSVTGVVALLAINFLMGGNLNSGLDLISRLPIQQEQRKITNQFDGKDSYEVFASEVLGSANDVWKTKTNNYREPALVLFRESTNSDCGGATSDVGPHYCPLDNTIYLDETFFEELTNRFGAKGGDVAEAYVIAHEVGHHVQHLSGTLSETSTNESQVKVELQADCYAGIWANSLKDQGVFLPDEIQEAIDAAASVGDDRIQKKVTGQVNPETWTHGSSQMRVSAFTTGYESGNVASCEDI